ncbi:hypothetical protein HNY42_08250 [Exiguobacterium sp. Helios]|uniref:hypothetical protein n=1 Tax=Exiguobacterium sp. Helios TaxID=2735868 RepID=UPI00165DF452|nr:hypothetical protein [Exiguobacterium sp. Helios]QNR20926.1 hypothetical protein HNY42_08250 [Exiguobacterium sp. Helios]
MKKKILSISILLMIGGVFGNILFTRLGYFPNADFRIMSIPLAAGAHYFNLGLVLFPWFLEKKQFSKTLLALILIIWLPEAV